MGYLGELPTDYLSAANHLRSSGDVLIAFANQWRAAAEQMNYGKHVDGYTVGDPSRARELAPLLKSRADLLQEFGEELNNSEPAGEG